MKVYGMSLGRERSIVAARNQREAAAAFGVSLYHMQNYSSVTGNRDEIEIAMSEPGTPFFAPYSGPERDVFSKLRESERKAS